VFAGSYPIWSQNEKLVFFEVDRQGKLVTSEHTSQIIYSPDIVFLEKDQLYIVGEKFSISKYDKDYNLISTIIPELYNCFFPFGAPLRINDSLYFRTGSDSSPVYPHLKEITRAVFNADAEYTDYYQISIPEYLDIPAQRYAISESGAQQYFLGGTSNSTGIPFETVDTRFALQKFDLSGNIFWENTYETGGNAVMIQVLALEDGGCLMAGQIYNWHQNPEQQLDLIFMKVDDNGIVTRIEENSNSGNQVYVYPNPGSNHLYFSTHQEIKRFVMYDINGRMVLDQCFPDEMLDVSFLFNGFYFWEMETKEGLILNGKWIKGR